MARPDHIYQMMLLAKTQQKKCFAVLLDPDKATAGSLEKRIRLANEAQVDFFFLGGSLIIKDRLNFCLDFIKQHSTIPTILFPGSPLQINSTADALLFLSLISGRNAELLIGQHVISAPYLYQSNLEIIGTGYMLIDGGVPTTVSYMSHTIPIPADKPEIALATALAGEMLGLKTLYMDSGSGALRPVSEEMIWTVSSKTSIPLIVGGGIRRPEIAYQSAQAGADVVVVGNSIEQSPGLIQELSAAIHDCSP